MSLLFISGEYPPDVGGVADYTVHLQAALVAIGRSSTVLSRRQVRRWDARSLLALLRRAPKHGIVHVQYQAAAFDLLGDVCLMPSLLHRLRPDVKVVTTFHDVRQPYLFPKAGRLREHAVSLLARSSDAVIAADARDLVLLGGPSPRHFEIPIGSNVACLPPDGYDREVFRREQLGVGPESLVVAYFGLLNASKGLDLLFDAFECVAAHRPDARLLMLGGDIGASDPTNATVAERVHSRLDQRVCQTGWLGPSELSAHLLAADVAVLPYVDGASGRRGSLLACAEHGLPIVSTLPAAAQVADAILAVPSDARALANATLRAATDATLRGSAQRLAARHTWPSIARAHLDVYESLDV